jgi:hypothetical protein
MGTASPSEEGATHRLLVPKGSVAAKLAEIYTVPLHSSYTAKTLHAICNENNVMQKFYHPLRMTWETTRPGKRCGAPWMIAAPSLRPWMRLVVYGHHVLDGELGVALRGGQALVAQEFLDGAQVRSFF